MSHELRTPVAVIKGAAEVLDDSSMTPDKQKNLLSIIQRHTLRLTGLFDDIAQLADMQMSGIQLEKSSGDIAALINDVVSELSDKAKQNDIKVETLFPSNLPKVPFHEKKMRRAVFHLIDNGIRYNKRGEKLIISARKDKSLTPPQLAISISDNGPGIPVEQREEMFKCFRQKTSSLDPNRASGLGVGLPLANSLINAHGGNLSLESSPQNGSTFTFTLPL
ncbi:MAG: HAMP domain-containing histidine kinase [Deltaproteobacteria bacterium]|nr:HAMP domain-containing histidine kinase [Deltaproteobacteria bacterium]